MSEILRVALLGGGKMALQHAAAIRQCPNARLVAVADPHMATEELKAKFGADIAAFSDTQSMLAEVQPGVVHVVTPPDTHASLARQCLEAGAHVYVEKPFALTTTDADTILRLAESKGLRACAAHQVLFQDAGRRYKQDLPMIGSVVHVESFFSFKPVRRRAGSGPSTPVDQLIDILPHPVYLLLDALPDEGGARAEITGLDISIDGEVRAVVRKGDVLAVLTVSLRARPVESWLRVMGTNGMVEVDFVLGNVIRHPGPGASAVSVVLKPFSRAWQTGWGSFKALSKLVFRRHKSYPGLAELLEQFYAHVMGRSAAPIQEAHILETVRLCETISNKLTHELRCAEAAAKAELCKREARMPATKPGGVVLLTGGTGLLGRRTAWNLRQRGWRVRVPVRRAVDCRESLPGIDYVLADLSRPLPDDLFADVETVVHLAAETMGNKADHERNTITATRNLIEAMRRRNVRRLINIGSVAVLTPSRFGRPLRENSAIDYGVESRGPYVWAKAEAEMMAIRAGSSGDIAVRTLRLGPLVDFENFQPPGRLGRELGRLYVAMGIPRSTLAVCDVGQAAYVVSCTVDFFERVPATVNVIESPVPTRGALVERLRRTRPDLKAIWMPFPVLWTLSLALRILQRILQPRRPALNLYAAFKAERYDDAVMGELVRSLQTLDARWCRQKHGPIADGTCCIQTPVSPPEYHR